MSWSGGGGVEFAASSAVNQATDLHGVDSVELETTAQVPVRLNIMNGPDTETLNLKQQRTEKDHNAVDRKSRENHMIKNSLFESELSILSTNESEGITKINDMSCSCNKDLGKNVHLVTSNVNANVMDVDTDSSKISKLKTKGPGAILERGLMNGCCNCHGKKTVLKVDEQGSLVSNVHDDLLQSQTLGNVNTTLQQMEDLENLTCNSHIIEPLSDLTKMVENVCLDSEASPDIQFSSSMEKFKPDTSQENLPCDEQAATCGDLLGGIDQSFGVIGPAGADLDDTDLEELPASLSDFVLGCHDDQYAVPPCPPNDSDINTIHIQKDDHPIVLVPYKSEVQMPDIIRLITKDLSEPYSIYTYRYFIHNWPQLCFLVSIHRKSSDFIHSIEVQLQLLQVI